MSGVEIVIAAAAAASLVSGGVSAYSQINAANQAADLQSKQIREQQVQTRLQENQASIERMKKLEATLATEEVMLGQRNIALGAGTANAFTINNMHNFLEDENSDKLNYAAKQLALARQRDLVYQQRKAQVINAVTGFVSNSANTILSAYGAPSQSLIDKSAGGGGGVSNAGGTYGAQQFQANQRSQFDLNA